MKTCGIVKSVAAVALLLTVCIAPNEVFAHCDTMDGPVVEAAQKALENGNVELVLIWVQKQDEAEIKKAFQETLAVRKLSPEAKKFADRYFFETLVRIHRAGEGAPYTGLKPAGLDLGPAIPAADKALADGSVEPLLTLLKGVMENGVREQFKHAADLKNYNPHDVEAGRKYVQAYVPFIHYIERLYEAAVHAAPGHYSETAEAEMHHE